MQGHIGVHRFETREFRHVQAGKAALNFASDCWLLFVALRERRMSFSAISAYVPLPLTIGLGEATYTFSFLSNLAVSSYSIICCTSETFGSLLTQLVVEEESLASHQGKPLSHMHSGSGARRCSSRESCDASVAAEQGACVCC